MFAVFVFIFTKYFKTKHLSFLLSIACYLEAERPLSKFEFILSENVIIQWYAMVIITRITELRFLPVFNLQDKYNQLN